MSKVNVKTIEACVKLLEVTLKDHMSSSNADEIVEVVVEILKKEINTTPPTQGGQ